MKIGLIGCYPRSYKDPFSTYLCLSSLENCLQAEGHSVTVLQPLILTGGFGLGEMDRLILVGNPFDEKRSPWSEWLVSLKPELSEKIILMGVKALQADTLRDEQKEILEKISKKHPIAVCEKGSKEQLSRFLNAKNVILSGLPAFWAESRPLRLKKKTRLFLPSALDPAFSKRPSNWAGLTHRFYKRWNQVHPVVYGGVHSDCLDLAATAGEWTLFQPSAPSLFLTSLISADAVVSGHTAELLVAVQNSVPGILLSNDTVEKSMADALGIPFLETHINSQAAELVHRAEELLSRYPWEAVKQKRSALQERTAEYLSEVGLAKKSHAPKKRTTTPMADRHWATVVGESNLSSLVGWVENILSVYDGRNHFHVLCGSRAVEAAVEMSLRPGSWTSYSLSSLWTEGEWQSCMRYDSTQVLRASKPRFLLRVLEDCKSEVFYADTQTVFFRDPVELVSAMEVPAALIARYADSNEDAALNGLYSASLFSVQPCAVPFLNWWASFTLEPRSAGMTVEKFSEGRILDSAPLLFPSIHIIREPGVLAESANLESTSIERPEWPGDRLQSFQGKTVAAFLSSSVDALHAHEIKTGWDQMASIFVQTRKAFESKRLRDSIWMQQRLHWPRLDAFFCAKEWIENHVPMVCHIAGPREVRFFTLGMGRWLVRLAGWLGFVAPPLGNARSAPPLTGGLWRTWQKTILRGSVSATPDSRHTQVA